MPIIESLFNISGAVIVVVTYGPVWLVWNFVGKWVLKVFYLVKDAADRHDGALIMEKYGNIESLRKALLHSFYNLTLAEAQACAR